LINYKIYDIGVSVKSLVDDILLKICKERFLNDIKIVSIMVENLEYRIGGIEINRDRINFNGEDPYEAAHKFVVAFTDNQVALYIAGARRHFQVADKFKLGDLGDLTFVGGGSCYIDKNGNLILNDYSGDYKAIPKEVAQTLAELLVPELQKQGIEVKGIVADPLLSKLNQFWKDRGFS